MSPRPAAPVPHTSATGRLIAPPRPPDPAFRSGTRQTARGIMADTFLKVLGVDSIEAEVAKERAMGDHVARYAADPVAWVRERAHGHPWSVQRRIMESVRDYRLTAVPSCHSAGKSWLAANIAGWWIDAHAPGEAFVVTSASTESQIKAVLWRELARVHTRASLAGRMTQAEWYLPMPGGKEELVAFGRKPADIDPTAFQGIHARYVLVLMDEAGGIAKALWEAADSLISNENSRFLAIGNPDDPESEFEKVCRPGSGWNVIPISAFDTPNFTGEAVPDAVRELLVSQTWASEKLRRWGASNPQYIARVLGKFPQIAQGGLIPSAWVRAAQEFDAVASRTATPPIYTPSSPIELGVDVGAGGDKTTIALREGPRVRIVHRDQNPDVMQTLGVVMQWIERTGATRTKIDNIGIGKGVADRAAEIARDTTLPKHTRERAKSILGINVGAAPLDREAYLNLRAEAYWSLRDRFQATASGNFTDGIDIDPADEDLAAQLSDASFKVTSNGKIQIESKEEMRRRGKVSPNDADAVMLAFCEGDGKPKRRGGTWGRRDQGLR